MTMAALGHVLAANVKTIPAIKPTTYKIRIGDLPENASFVRRHMPKTPPPNRGSDYSILSVNSTIIANNNATAKIIGMASSTVNHSAVLDDALRSSEVRDHVSIQDIATPRSGRRPCCRGGYLRRNVLA
jgi:hypothetical protein